LKITMIHRSNTAVGYYRLWMPAKWLGLMEGWNVTRFPSWATFDRLLVLPKASVDLEAEAAGSDVLVYQWGYSPQEVAAMQAIRQATGAPSLMDLDDDVLAVPEGHQSYPAFKPRTPDECLQMVTLPVEAVPLFAARGWRVGRRPDGVNVAVRQVALDFPTTFKEGVQAFDGIVASPPAISRSYWPLLAPGAAMYEAPNCFDPEDWAHVTPAPERAYPTILWAGSNAHGDNVMVAFEGLRRLARKVKDLRVVVLGAKLPVWDKLGLPIDYLGWVGWHGYHETLASTGAWVGIAPMTDEPFNHAKSHIRWMEYALAGLPCVGSPSPEFEKWAAPAYVSASTPDER